jgi:type III pantothenate kinase
VGKLYFETADKTAPGEMYVRAFDRVMLSLAAIERMEAELGEPAAVIATGGLGGCIIPYCRREITYDKNLLLNGLWALYQKNKRKR